jgi:hypothetical protein
MRSIRRSLASRFGSFALCSVGLTLSGCAARSHANGAVSVNGDDSRAFVISAAEIERSQEPTVTELVERRRPQWGIVPAQHRGPDTLLGWTAPDPGKQLFFVSATPPCARVGASTPTSAVAELEYVQPGTAIPHCGSVWSNGVVLLHYRE